MRTKPASRELFLSLLILILLTFWVVPVLAHHASTPHFDKNKPVTISGVVTEFKLVNPHAYIYLDVMDEQGTATNWNCELHAASLLKRNGWTKEMLKPGTKVTLNGHAARRDPQGCTFIDGEYGEGLKFSRNGKINQDAMAAVAEPDVSVNTPATTSTSKQNQAFAGVWKAGLPQGGPPPGLDGPTNDTAGVRERLGRYADIVTPAGEQAAAGYDMRFDDPALSCSPSSIIRAWGEPFIASRISVADDVITIEHEFMDTKRTVYLKNQSQPIDAAVDFRGNSTGRYMGNSIVIETSGFPAGVLLPHPGVMHGESMVVSEKLTLSEDGNKLTRDYIVIDKEFLKEPITGTNTWLRTNTELDSFDCQELSGINNVRPE